MHHIKSTFHTYLRCAWATCVLALSSLGCDGGKSPTGPNVPTDRWLIHQVATEYIADLELTQEGVYIAGGRDGFYFLDFHTDSTIQCGPEDSSWANAPLGVGARCVTVCGASVYFGIQPTHPPASTLFRSESSSFPGSEPGVPIAIQSRNVIALASSPAIGAVGISAIDGAFNDGGCTVNWIPSGLDAGWRVASLGVQAERVFAYGESPIELPAVFVGAKSENGLLQWTDFLTVDQVLWLGERGSEVTGFAQVRNAAAADCAIGLKGPDGGIYLLRSEPDHNSKLLSWVDGPFMVGNHSLSSVVIAADSLYLLCSSVFHQGQARLVTLGELPFSADSSTALAVDWENQVIAVSAQIGLSFPAIYVKQFPQLTAS